eukprot:gnl/TRDRNA2_/TRDRNA2_158906_c2_seq1.p1 gnl/TRDRNA2_/TRDRNA2_158906_c2~~gnl/TRDRNA2_/TRDRNA2_158906_c2_seq1.p1  ORF type:complete len:161 (+),score=14.94 gnl/TRDRNA2_/TRDRNA2_158906_c2_seq1:72-554(+)
MRRGCPGSTHVISTADTDGASGLTENCTAIDRTKARPSSPNCVRPLHALRQFMPVNRTVGPLHAAGRCFMRLWKKLARSAKVRDADRAMAGLDFEPKRLLLYQRCYYTNGSNTATGARLIENVSWRSICCCIWQRCDRHMLGLRTKWRLPEAAVISPMKQ